MVFLDTAALIKKSTVTFKSQLEVLIEESQVKWPERANALIKKIDAEMNDVCAFDAPKPEMDEKIAKRLKMSGLSENSTEVIKKDIDAELQSYRAFGLNNYVKCLP